MGRSRVDDVERCAYDAWPAEEVFALGGWRLRATGGVTRRGNSVWPGEATGGLSLDERIERVEAWYTARALRPAFQVHALAAPEGLDVALEARGYAIDAPVSVQVAPTASAAALARPASLPPARVTAELTAEWFEVSAYRGRFAATADVYRRLLQRIGRRARYAWVDVDGRPGAVGLGVLGADARMGVFSMLTVPEVRRRGAARSVLRALAETAQREQKTELYLQVEQDNAVARGLYAAASFQELYGYHYRVRATRP
jgi:ribosomal protein S18 acetylase RimI-like enzyme